MQLSQLHKNRKSNKESQPLKNRTVFQIRRSSIKDGDVLVSGREIFALGFFSAGNSSNRYVGVWYNQISNQTVVWVANRDNPVPDTSGVLSINGDGGLVIYGNNRSFPLWSANVTLSSPNNSIAKLLDTGNLVLLENEDSQKVIWQGFDYPTDTMLPLMKIGLDRRSGLNRFLTSWKSKDDPGTGSCSCRLDPSGFPQMILYKDGAPWWRDEVASWVGQSCCTVTILVNNADEVSIMSSAKNNQSNFSRTVLDESGTFRRFTWNDRAQKWTELWSAPIERCDFYGQCGPNGNCDPYVTNTIDCICLPGFEPKSPTDWYSRDGTDGCVKKKGVSTCRNGEKFVNLESMKIPDLSRALVNMNMSMKACKQECLKNCSCVAYSSSDKTGCVTWYGELMDTRVQPSNGQNLYVRVDATVFAQYAKKSNDSLSKKEKLAISLVSVLALFLLVFLVYWLLRMKRKGKRRRDEYSFSFFNESTGGMEPAESSISSDLPFFDLTTIAAATDNFSLANKLGTGGFGSVYKGVLFNGKEIAVKRLSKTSGQGIEEFKNEVLLIAKLQHRNLVRILGCCVQDEEKMLIYEYLPNKGLDFFIFNETNKALLDWTKRFEIIHGITRGIIYLHQDSRLRIIHRDLKASNVLLDASMNPKIADFGMARIFKGDQNEANTKRVVGTYGYMSPEYAMQGRFSVKSDVYSYGVLLIEIITGRKNNGFYHEEHPYSNLVGHVWNLWSEGKVLQIVDSSIGESYPVNEVLKCIQIAFLCLQEYPADRPTMSEVLFMLGNDADALPSPRKLAFLLERSSSSMGGKLSTHEGYHSLNNFTCSVVEAR
ncbi:G-type lectin S-receptor-like serine/threonine-protein kinase RKS1 isoform X3 [Rosa chinensis]|uniref:G-type lectin S-receptor-like serine/threonine-protein kinase RKS1 isoform X3 n=1 Tax=Rosa chinensis TaxID=74649 RepID=UPI000D08892F|nr:G-type lectin S-receptor-like serine/threonine-protein kinase RKS1 isoform X3 [Rosa chinensis]